MTLVEGGISEIFSMRQTGARWLFWNKSFIINAPVNFPVGDYCAELGRRAERDRPVGAVEWFFRRR